MILSHSFILLFLRLFFSLHILDHITPEVFTKVWIITCIDNNLHFHLQFTIYILQCETVEFALLVSLCVCVCVCVCVHVCVHVCVRVCVCRWQLFAPDMEHLDISFLACSTHWKSLSHSAGIFTVHYFWWVTGVWLFFCLTVSLT